MDKGNFEFYYDGDKIKWNYIRSTVEWQIGQLPI